MLKKWKVIEKIGIAFSVALLVLYFAAFVAGKKDALGEVGLCLMLIVAEYRLYRARYPKCKACTA